MTDTVSAELRLKFKLPNQSGAGEIADPGIIYADAKAHGGLCCSLARLFWPTLGLALAHAFLGGCGLVDQTLLEGDYAVVTKQVWCMESKEALSELQDRAFRGSYEEMTRTYSRKGLATLELGDQVRVVDRRFGGAVKVRSASDQECWTVPNALQKIGLAKQSKSRESETVSCRCAHPKWCYMHDYPH